jgi:hypothetical protein
MKVLSCLGDVGRNDAVVEKRDGRKAVEARESEDILRGRDDLEMDSQPALRGRHSYFVATT